MRRTNIYLTDSQCEQLDERAHVEGISRASLIRAILDRALNGQRDSLDSDIGAITESFGATEREATDFGRADGDRAAHLVRVATLSAPPG